MAAEFIRMVVMTSLTFILTLSTAGIHAYAPPAAMAASRHSGTPIHGDSPASLAPTMAEAMAPRYSWPSPPTLKIPAWAATAVARPVRHSVADLARVLPMARFVPKAPWNIST